MNNYNVNLLDEVIILEGKYKNKTGVVYSMKVTHSRLISCEVVLDGTDNKVCVAGANVKRMLPRRSIGRTSDFGSENCGSSPHGVTK